MEQLKTGYYCTLTALSAAGAWIASALGGWDAALQTLCILMAADYLCGLACALVWHRSSKSADGAFESRASLKGLLRKGGILLVVLISARLDQAALTGGYVRTAVILFFVANEGFSILENLGIMGVPMPAALKRAFSALRSREDGEGEGKGSV